MKTEKEDVTTSTIITERFDGQFLITETNTETTHIKLHSTDSNTFSFSLSHEIESQQPLHHVEHVIIDEHLVSNETCTLHLTNLLSNIYLQLSTTNYIISYISTEAINWKKSQGEKGSKIEVNVKENEESSSEVRCMELRCTSDEKKKKKMNTERSYVSTITTEQIKGCILEKVVLTKEIQIKTRSNESNSFSFSLNLNSEKNPKIHHGNLDGHKIRVSLSRPDSRNKKNKIEYTFSDQFHTSKEVCDEQLLIILSETDISSKIREYIVDYLSREAARWDLVNGGEGVIVEVNVEDNVDSSFEVEYCSGEEDKCSSRISTARMTETECVICLKGLLGEVKRMELSCSHLFHKDCMMTWLSNHSSCPLCRNNVDDKVSFYC